jgi:hypothetical protein
MKILKFTRIYTRHRCRIFFKGFLENLHGARHQRNALVSYVTKPFTHRLLKGHTNIAEAHVITRIFDRLGYNVDLVDYFYERPFRYEKYDLIFGFGTPFEQSFATSRPLRRIYYGTTCHQHFNNTAELRRIREIREKTGILLQPHCLLELAWSRSTGLADALIILGNAHTAGTYQICPHPPIYTLNATALAAPRDSSGKDLSSARRAFLWFGSTNGGVHKGLDLCLDYFAASPSLTLHLCGRIEEDLAQLYRTELSSPNIRSHGFVDVDGPVFQEATRSCAFAILPTCSEGQATSLLTVMGQGLIPIATAASGIDLDGLGIQIDELSMAGVGRSIEKAQGFSPAELEQLSRKNTERIREHHTLGKFEQNLERILSQVAG